MLRAVKRVCVGGGGAGAVNTLSCVCVDVCMCAKNTRERESFALTTIHRRVQCTVTIIEDLSEYSNALAYSFWPQVLHRQTL